MPLRPLWFIPKLLCCRNRARRRSNRRGNRTVCQSARARVDGKYADVLRTFVRCKDKFAGGIYRDENRFGACRKWRLGLGKLGGYASRRIQGKRRNVVTAQICRIQKLAR